MYVSPGEHNKLALLTPIPVGTVLECEYAYQYFAYTSYNGVNGWIVDSEVYFSKSIKVAYKSDRNMITITKAPTYSQPSIEYKRIQDIPQNTELHGMWEFNDYTMVTYDNENVWIQSEDVAGEANEVYDETIEFSEDLIIDDKVLISKGETVKLYSKYWVWDENYYILIDYYFAYKDSGFFESDLGIFYPVNYYVMLFENYKNLPINQELKVKYYRTFQSHPDDFLELVLSGRFYIEYNNKIYDMKTYYDVDCMIITNDNYIVYIATTDFDLLKSPYENEVAAKISSGDILYAPYVMGTTHRFFYNYFKTEKGVSGFVDEDMVSHIASSVTKDELSDYIKASKSNTTQFINVGNSGEYSEYLKYNLSGDYTTNKEITFNINFFSDEPQEKIIPIQSKITMLGTAAIVKNEHESNLYYQISYDGQSGYAKFVEGDLTEVIAKPSGELVDANSGEDRINVYDIQNKKKEASDLVICILCICGAAILALTVIVTIKLVNKSSKKNSDSDKENNDTNTNA